MSKPKVLNIPAGRPFAKILAQTLLDEYKTREQELSQVLILLPTRRACRVLQDTFLQLRGQQALILPRMQPVGDLDEEELSLSLMGHEEQWSLPPALSSMRRQILLAKLVQKLQPENSHEQALKLAHALGHLMDQIYTENLDMADLSTLAPEEFAEHWQITLKFLEILSAHWPKILEDEGVIDEADRRNRLILTLAELWEKHPPAYPVIAAGSTGSIPSTARLLSVVADLPQGQVILPGLDADIDEESWEDLSENHPQFGFKQLLGRMNVARENVKIFGGQEENSPRQLLAREIMRPAETVGHWATLAGDKQSKTTLQNSLEDLSLINCGHSREEADTIAILLRETLETPGKTACLITPDRTLAARVTAACRRWNITIDDSAGQSLSDTPHGILLHLVTGVLQSHFAPVALLSLLKHPLCQIDTKALQALDYALRGTKPAPGITGLKTHIEAQEKLDELTQQSALSLLQNLQETFAPLEKLLQQKQNFSVFLKAHIGLCETLATNPETHGSEILWSGETGNKTAAFLTGITEQSHDFEAMDFADYAATLSHFMGLETIRPAFGTHPRLQILGQLEARLIDADLVILGGLNEGIWPPDAATDPWMSRPMRKEFGLPSPERSIGLAAHDFVQGLSNADVIITRTERQDGAPTVPSRWLQRLDAVLQAAQIDAAVLDMPKARHWAVALDHADETSPIARPVPCPPVKARPRRLSVTQIETWLRDPYAIYARHILGLRVMEPLEKPIDAAERGTLIHKILERFTLQTREKLPQNSAALLTTIAREELDKRAEDPDVWSFWWPRFAKTAQWLEQHEKQWRAQNRNIASETRGEIIIQTSGKPFTLSAIADRIDADNAGGAAIIDYKSGGSYSKKKIESGELPQLPLEALILREGGFAGCDAYAPGSLQYWVLSGPAGGSITALDETLETLSDQTHESLKQLIQIYDDPDMPYMSLPRPDQAPRFNDYEHLARIREWNVAAGESEQEAA